MNANPLVVLVAVIVVTLLLISTVIGLGYLGSLIVGALTGFLNHNLGQAGALADYDAATLKALSAGAAPAVTSVRPAPEGPASYPIDRAVFGGFLILAFLLFVIPLWAAPPGRHVTIPQILRLYEPEVVTPTPAATAVPVGEPGVLPKTAAGLPPGSAAGGKQQFNALGCSSCHAIAKDQKLVGPSLYGIWNTAATRKPGMAARDYIFESILNPDAYIVDGFTKGIMTPTYAQALTAQQLADLIAYAEKELSLK